MMTYKWMLAAALCCSLPVLVSCAGAQLDAPAGYAEVKHSRFKQKLMSPGGTVIALRQFDNPDDKAGLDYWAQALEIQKTEKDQMELIAREDIQTARGLPGKLFSFDVGEGSARIRYLIGLFVKPDVILAVEVGGKIEAIEADREAILAAIRSLH